MVLYSVSICIIISDYLPDASWTQGPARQHCAPPGGHSRQERSSVYSSSNVSTSQLFICFFFTLSVRMPVSVRPLELASWHLEKKEKQQQGLLFASYTTFT